MPEHRWAVETATGELLYGGAEPYDCASGLSAGQTRVVLASQPDPRTQKWNGAAVVAKSAAEVAAFDNRDHDRDRVIERARPTITSGSLSLDVDEQRYFRVPLQRDVQVSFGTIPEVAAAALVVTLAVIVSPGAVRAMTWPKAVRWPSGTAPTFDAGDGTYLIELRRLDDNAVWFGTMAGPFN